MTPQTDTAKAMPRPVFKIKIQGHELELHPYNAGETVEIFKGSTGIFGHGGGSKTAGIVYVCRNGGVQANDYDVAAPQVWEWLQTRFDAMQSEINALNAVAEAAQKFQEEQASLDSAGERRTESERIQARIFYRNTVAEADEKLSQALSALESIRKNNLPV